MAAGGIKQELQGADFEEMDVKEETADGDVELDTISVAPATAKSSATATSSALYDSRTGTPAGYKSTSRSPMKREQSADSPAVKSEQVDTVGGDVTLKLEPGKPPKLSRSISQKVEKRPPQLFFDYENKTAEATSTFEVLSACTYANKYLGTTEHALECDCAEEWDASTRTNHACGEDSDCINRATKMECIGDCGCGTDCQNQRFQRKQYANVTVIKTEKKGYGLRTESNLKANDFIFEYIGEVIGENVFRRRMTQYDEEGIKHFYFMSLTKGEFVDATKRGNLGRFCNHSCNPNCYVDKWVVGDKLRMGIFAERNIQAGEELVFNYNVDRYGADPQPCYCGEPNCTGYIGGKTQTERATKLSNAIIEALGIDDADAWDTAVARRPRKKKAGEDDEEYVNNVEPRGLDEEGVNKVMSSLMQCKEKWIAVKLLTRIQRAEDDRVRNRVVRFHGYRILKTALANFSDDVNVCLQILDILDKMPRLTRNKIQDSKIEESVGGLVTSEDERVAARAQALVTAWSQLEMAYRIPRVKRDPNTAATQDRKADVFNRREQDQRRRSRSRTKSPERIQAPTGPRNNAPPRRPPHRFRPPPHGALPPGWFEANAANGSTYYYNQAGATTWQRPTLPAASAPPPPPPKAVADHQIIQDLIKNIVNTKKEPARQVSVTTTPVETPKKERREDKWRTLPIEKQKKLYESALQPHIMHVLNKYRSKLAKDDLKRWAKEFAKQMVESDFRKNRVEDVNKISEKRAKDVKKHAQTFFDKAVKKKEAAELKKADRSSKPTDPAGASTDTPAESPGQGPGSPMVEDDASDGEPDVSRDMIDATPAESETTDGLKRRRDNEDADVSMLDVDDAASKKQRTESAEPPPPPPPPPPPVDPDAEYDMLNGANGTPSADVVGDNTGSGVNGGGNGYGHGDASMQTATPSSLSASPAAESFSKATYGGMNPERLRQLGIGDG